MNETHRSEPPRPPSPRLQERERLLWIAEQAFSELGYHASTVDEVATRAGLTRAQVYEHFATRDDLYLECAGRARRELEDAIFTAVAAQTAPALQFRAAALAYFTFVRERGRAWEALFAGRGGAPVATRAAERATRRRNTTTDKLAALLLAAAPEIAPIDVEACAYIASGAAQHLARWWRQRPDVPIDQVVDRLMAVVWHGLEHIAPPPQRPDLTIVSTPPTAA